MFYTRELRLGGLCLCWCGFLDSRGNHRIRFLTCVSSLHFPPFCRSPVSGRTPFGPDLPNPLSCCGNRSRSPRRPCSATPTRWRGPQSAVDRFCGARPGKRPCLPKRWPSPGRGCPSLALLPAVLCVQGRISRGEGPKRAARKLVTVARRESGMGDGWEVVMDLQSLSVKGIRPWGDDRTSSASAAEFPCASEDCAS